MPTDKQVRKALDAMHVRARTAPKAIGAKLPVVSKLGFTKTNSPQTAADRLRAELRRASNTSKRGVSLAPISKGKSED